MLGIEFPGTTENSSSLCVLVYNKHNHENNYLLWPYFDAPWAILEIAKVHVKEWSCYCVTIFFLSFCFSVANTAISPWGRTGDRNVRSFHQKWRNATSWRWDHRRRSFWGATNEGADRQDDGVWSQRPTDYTASAGCPRRVERSGQTQRKLLQLFVVSHLKGCHMTLHVRRLWPHTYMR